MKNIVLIGMPAVGKSTVGVVVAKHLGYQFIDTDILIQQRENRLLKSLTTTEKLLKTYQKQERVILTPG